MEIVDDLFKKFIYPIITIYQIGGVEWIERNYSDEFKCIDEKLNEAILAYRSKKLNTLELTREFKNYNRSMMRWITEYKLKHCGKNLLDQQAANL